MGRVVPGGIPTVIPARGRTGVACPDQPGEGVIAEGLVIGLRAATRPAGAEPGGAGSGRAQVGVVAVLLAGEPGAAGSVVGDGVDLGTWSESEQGDIHIR